MTALAHAILHPLDTTGISEAARHIAKESHLITCRLQESIMLGFDGKGVIGELDLVFEECSQPNWDGYNGLPVLPETYANVRSFLETLPLGSTAPSVGAEPDGHLTLEWYSARHRTLSVSIGPDGNLHYAAIIGPIKRYGTEPIGTYVSEVEELVRKVTAN